MFRFVIALLAAFAAPLLAQLDRGAITGNVLDPTGLGVPNAQVRAIQLSTGSVYQTVASESGQYTIPNLPAGEYDVRVQSPSFKGLRRSGVRIGVTEVVRVDVTLEIGSTSESVTVSTAIPKLNTDTGELATNLSNKQLVDLPFSFAFGRLIENLTYRIAPGVQGNRWQNNVNGSVFFTREALVDGAPVSTNVAGGAVLNAVSMEGVQEFKVQTSGMSAEFGRTNSAVFNYVMKSGSNELHGSAYGSLRNEALNSNSPANNARGIPRPLDRKQNYAFSLGGPVWIPKIYNGRNRTFFYSTFEHYRDRNLIFGSPNITMPVGEFYDGDFSRLLGPNTGQVDALGRPVARGAIYDPATFRRLESGRYIGEMFPGNRIPVSRFSQVSRNLNEILKSQYIPPVVGPDGLAPLVNNSYAPTNVIPISDEYMFSIKGDQVITSKHRLSGSFSLDNNPRTLMNQNGLFNNRDPLGGPLARIIPQVTRGRLGRASHDWLVSPSIVNHVTLSYNRLSSDNASHVADIDGAAQMGIRGLSTFGYPEIIWNAGPFVTPETAGRVNKSFSAQSAWGFLNTLSVSRGRHFVKFGYDMRRNHNNARPVAGGAFTFHPRATAIPNEPFAGNLTGYSVASYLLGIVDSASLSDPVGRGARIHYYSLFVQDDFKLSRRLTLNLGMRWEFQPPMFEVADRLASWTPNKIDPASGLPGAYEFAGTCNACTGKRYFGSRSYRDFGPRIGFAFRAADRWTLRGAYGILYIPDLFNGSGTTPFGNATSFQAAGTYQLEADPVNPWAGIFNWDAGFPNNRFVDPSFDPSWGNRNRPAMIDSNYGRTGYTQQWNLNVQRELGYRFVLDIGYVGTKSTGLRVSELARVNQTSPEHLTRFGRNLNNPVRNAAEAAANGIAYPYAGFQGTVASALRPFPQVQGNQTIQVYGAPLGFGSYHSLQVTLNREFANGLTVYSNYVWSKNLGNMESLMLNDNPGRPLDYYNLRLEKSISPSDRPHFVKVFANYEIPVGRGKALLSNANRLTTFLLGGWSASGILNYSSGTPLGATGSLPLSGGWNGTVGRANVAAGELLRDYDRSKFDAINSANPANAYLDKSKFSDPAPLTLGTGAFRYAQARTFGTIAEDLALIKNHYFHNERTRLQIRADMLNAFNRVTPGAINTAVTSPLFGQITNIGGGRTVQVALRVDF